MVSHSFMPLQNQKIKNPASFRGWTGVRMTDLWRLASMRLGATLAAFRKESESIKKLSKVIGSNNHGVFYKNTNKISSNKATENFLKCS